MRKTKNHLEKMKTILRESMDTIQNKTQKSTIKKNIEDTEIEILDKKRKELRQKANKTLKDKEEYAELKKLVKRKDKSTEEKKGINTGNIRSKKGSKTDQ